MRVLLVTLLLLLVGLAGCASEGDSPTNDAGNGDGGDNTNSGNGTIDDPGNGGNNGTANGNSTTNETVENLVPVINVTADIVNGTAPLLVTFNLTIEDDSENLTWSFFLEGTAMQNGTGAAAVVNHTFTAGSWFVEFVASDGEHEATANMTIEVQGAAPEPVVINGHVTYNAHVVGMCESEASAVPAEVIGWSYQVLTADYEATWFDAADGELGTGSSGAVPTGAVTVKACYGGDFSIGVLPPLTNGADWSIKATAPGA